MLQEYYCLEGCFLFFCGEVNQTFVRKINLTLCHLAVRSFNEAKLVDFREHTE